MFTGVNKNWIEEIKKKIGKMFLFISIQAADVRKT